MGKSKQDTQLNAFLKKIQKRMLLQKIMSTPITFEDVRMITFNEQAQAYYTIKLCEDWIDAVPKRIDEWVDIINEYFDEFVGSWEYYATSKRLDSIREYGPSDDDLDENGEIRTEGVTCDKLKPYTVIHELYHYDFRDILQDFILDDIKHLQLAIMFDAAIDIKSMFKDVTGKSIDTYVVSEDRQHVRKLEFGEYELRKISNQIDAEDESRLLYTLVYIIYRMMSYLRSMEDDVFDNHKEFLERMRDDCYKIREMRLSEVSYIVDLEKELNTNE